MTPIPIEAGRVVRSTAGRDRGRYLLVIARIDHEYLLVADGSLRSVSKPKKKKERHVRPTPLTLFEEELGKGMPPPDAHLRRALADSGYGPAPKGHKEG